MASASIFTLEPERGGVPALAKAVAEVIHGRGHIPRLVYRASDEVPTVSRWAQLKYFLTTPPVREIPKERWPGMAVADYPLPPRYQYHLLRLASKSLQAPIAAVVSGSNHVGLPLALARKRYVVWVATLYADELQGRADAGDRWAAGLLAHRDWPALAAQEQMIFERAALILGLSPHTTHRIAQQYPTVQTKLRTVLYPVDTWSLRPTQTDSEQPYIFLSARIRDPRKNVDLLVRAFALLRMSLPNIRLVIAGDTPAESTKTLVQDLNLAGAIQFVGYVSQSELVELYQRASLFVLPSQQEGLCISVLEAMACGVPVVSTRCGGPEGIVQEGVTGCLVPTGDAQALAQASLQILRQPDYHRQLAVNSRHRSEQEFSRERVNAQLAAAFQETFSDIW
jgi:glycosyltransferase involved in cell wall biosynthesis